VAYNEELAEPVRETLADRTDVAEKRMFGGLTFMVAGHMCCGVLKNDLIVRIEPSDFETLVAQLHVRPFDFTGRPMQNMVYVEVAALSDPVALRTWVQRGTEYVAVHPRRPNGTKAKARAPGSLRRATIVGGTNLAMCARARPSPA
jgi:TfoX/Sxy family transcriptional regulator of competence genes